ncbi:HAD-IC family P-type ATPase [Candidatus Uhrbacteria bacterium]|nr:HAD-IC family P-type ATPase [Candidatus Uhrbacteria bacterium]
MTSWHTLSPSRIATELDTNLEEGLSEATVADRQRTFGFNRLPGKKSDSLAIIFFRQFKSPFFAVLACSASILFALNSVTDGFIILFVLVFNACIGTIQEGRAQNTLAALKNFVQTRATVIRSGVELIIDDTELVPGDVILITEGERIPADARVLKSEGLRVNESALTGETALAGKSMAALKDLRLPVSGQSNMVFKGTIAGAGSGRAVVTATGICTEIGKIGEEIETIREDIPLQQRIASFGKTILLITASVCGILFLLGMMAGTPLVDMFATVISLSVSIIPEGLPIVITLVLATGVYRMARRRAIIKKMQAVEALGEASVIAVDKTGTITKNEMVVRTVVCGANTYSVTGSGYNPNGTVAALKGTLTATQKKEVVHFAKLLLFTANAHVAYNEVKDLWQVTGDPSEAAMITFAEKLGFRKDELFDSCPRRAELPFNSETKYHATLHGADTNRAILSVAGAPELILALCSHVSENGKKKRLTQAQSRLFSEQIAVFAKEGKRIIALAWDEGVQKSTVSIEAARVKNLVFGGFICIEDSLRAEVCDAVLKARTAGIRIIMMTGDAPLTAQAIASQAGIFSRGDMVLTGADIERRSAHELARDLSRVSVFARMTPEHKLAIIRAYKERGDSIAMTGDGVNDAPALMAADLGISMGKIGTDVAKEASDIVLLDDNLSSIVAAIEEGRGVIRGIRRVILYLMTNNVTEVSLVAIALLAGLPLPLLPAQIIWLNLITDTFLDAAIGMEGNHGGLAARSKVSVSLFDVPMARRLLVMALPSTIVCVLLLLFLQSAPTPTMYSMIVTTIAVTQWFNAWNCRSETASVFSRSTFFSNRFLLGALAIVFILHNFALSHPFLQNILHLQPLSLAEWMVCIAAGSSALLFEETRKWLARRAHREIALSSARELALAPKPVTVTQS